MTYVLLIPGVIVYVIALVLVYVLIYVLIYVLRKLARDADREVRRAVEMLTPLSDVSVVQSGQDLRPHQKPTRDRNWRNSQIAPHATIAALVEP